MTSKSPEYRVVATPSFKCYRESETAGALFCQCVKLTCDVSCNLRGIWCNCRHL